jgi:choline transport protein
MAEAKSLNINPQGFVSEVVAEKDDHKDAVQENGFSPRQRTQLERYLSLKPMVAFGLNLQSSWEGIAISFQAALLNGGPVSLTYGIIIAAVGSSAIALSLGEMASM